jgi:2-C-methyl-D-erythritol 4-phosphate cytidylyltransferase
MNVTAIILAAGESRRLQHKKRKPYIKIGSKPILLHTLCKIVSFDAVKDINLVVNRKDRNKALKLVKEEDFKKDIKIIEGSKKRSGSVYEGLKRLPDDCQYVLIHDAVRPFFKIFLVEELIKEAVHYKAVIPAVKVKSTIKTSSDDYLIEKTLNRNRLWSVQTPQIFEKELILKAYHEADLKKNYTDDAQVVEEAGYKVKVIESDEENIKITTPLDLEIARILIKRK